MLQISDIKKILKTKGKVRGDVLKTDLKYIEKKEGKEKLKKLTDKLEKYMPGFNLKELINTNWYPIGWKVVLLEETRDVFSWTDKEIIEMGELASKESFIIKTILRYFVSIERTFKETNKYWKKYWEAGEFLPYKLNLNEKYLIIRLKNFKIHPDLCLYFEGHFKSIANLILNSKSITIKETSCEFKNDNFHEFQINWQ